MPTREKLPNQIPSDILDQQNGSQKDGVKVMRVPATASEPEAKHQAFITATLQALIDHFGWDKEPAYNDELLWARKVIGGNPIPHPMNPKGTRSIRAHVEGLYLLAYHGDTAVAQSWFDVSKTPKQNAGELNHEINLINPIHPLTEFINWDKSKNLDTQASIRALGTAVIDEVGSENIYVIKDGQPYYFKPGSTSNYAVGEHDFSSDNAYGEAISQNDDDLDVSPSW